MASACSRSHLTPSTRNLCIAAFAICASTWVPVIAALRLAQEPVAAQRLAQERFLQLGGFFDAYDRSDETVWTDQIFGSCSPYTPPYGPLDNDWANTGGWSVAGTSTIRYSGGGDSQHKPFWLWFWKQRRWWTSNALLKKNYICQQTKAAAGIKLQGADRAGLIFRVRGTFDFWGVVVANGGREAQLIWVCEGRETKFFSMPCSPSPQGWTDIVVEEAIIDVNVTCGSGAQTTSRLHKLESIDELTTPQMGAAGLIAFNGGAEFNNVLLTEVDWTPDMGNVPELISAEKKTAEAAKPKVAAMDFGDLASALSSWCPPPSYCHSSIPFKIVELPP